MKKALFALAILALIVPCLAARTIYVDPNAAGDYPTIQAAIDNANNGDAVVLAPGTYTGDGNRDIDFLGKAITVRSIDANDPCTVASTVIDCNASFLSFHRAFYFHSGEGPDSVIAGLTIIRGLGRFLPYPVGATGHAIACNSASPTITNCIISSCGLEGFYIDYSQALFFNDSDAIISGCNIVDNQSNGLGAQDSNVAIIDCLISGNWTGIELGVTLPSEVGCAADITNCRILRNNAALHAFNSDVNIIDCVVSENTAALKTAGIVAYSSNLKITDCIITENKTLFTGRDGHYTSDGGGISLQGGTALLQRCSISKNVSKQWGGGICCFSGETDIRDCNIVSNTAGTETEFPHILIGKGGGIYCQDGRLAISNSTIEQNICVKYPFAQYPTTGGGIFNSGPAEIHNSIISNNGAEQGGGLFIDADANVVNCAITDNSGADSGSGLYQKSGSTKLVNCTLAGNNQGINGTPIMLLGGTTTIINSILWDKGGPEITKDYFSFNDIVSYSDIRGGSTQWWGTNNIDQDPLFAAEGNYHLTIGSPCIDSGTNDPGLVLPPRDLDGTARPTDGDADGLAIADMGAYEFDPNHLVLAAGPKLISFTYDALDDPPQKTLSIRSAAGQPIDWQISGKADWLGVSPRNGTAANGTTEVTLTADGNGLPAGDYECRLVVADTEGKLEPTSIAVALHIGEVRSVPDDFCCIQDAIDDANDYDVVLVADGNYTGPHNRDLDFKGKKIIVRSQNGPDNCIIDCKEGPFWYPSHVGFYFHSGETGESILKGFTITGGQGVEFAQLYHDRVGGAIACICSSPTITQCRIEDNFAPWYGGGIYFYRSNAAISDCIISGNRSDFFLGYGGGISCDFSGVRILDCIISGNKAGFGAGIDIQAGDSLVDGCQIIGNEAGYDNGGAMINAGTIKNSLIKANVAHSNAGGVSLKNTAKLINCTITENRAKWNGGIECSGNSKVENCLITANKSTDTYGAIRCMPESFLAQYQYPGPIIINNCTVIGNSGLDKYNGLYSEVYTTPPVITNSIFRNGGEEIYGKAEVSYCNIEGGFTGQGNIDTDPNFAFQADAHLMPGSTCIDAGTNHPPAGLPQTDLYGSSRLIDGDNDTVAIVDMGTCEFNPNTPTIALSQPAATFKYYLDYRKPRPTIISVRNAGFGKLRWTASVDCNWLEVNPSCGVSTGDINDILLTLTDTNSMVPGVYAATLSIEDPNANNSPGIVHIILYVNRTLFVPSLYPTIQNAIDNADDGDLVLLADGTYTGKGNRDIQFMGKTIILRSENGPENCVIDCEGTPQDPHRGFMFNRYERDDSVIDGLTITNGWAGRHSAGAIYFEGNTYLVIRNCYIIGNTGTSDGAVSGGDPKFFNCKFISNQHGAVRAQSPDFYNCIFTANKGTVVRAHIPRISNPKPMNIHNCLFAGNEGMALNIYSDFHSNTTVSIQNCTFVGNKSDETYSVTNITASSIDILSSIFRDNTSSDFSLISCYSRDRTNIDYCNIEGGQVNCRFSGAGTVNFGQGNIDADPCFVDPGYWDVNATPNDVNDDFWADGDYHLLPESLCIDAGDPNYVPAPGQTDLYGNPRVLDGDKDGKAVVDMGACEYVPPIEAKVRFTPRVLNLKSRGKFVLCVITLPEDYSLGDIDRTSILLQDQIQPRRVFISEKYRVALALFNRADLQAILHPGRIELLLTGQLNNGILFEGADTVRVINPRRRPWQRRWPRHRRHRR